MRSFKSHPCWYRVLASAAILFSVGLSVSRSASGQAVAQSNDSTAPAARITAESNLVLLRVVVQDAHGVPVKGLRKEDFKLLDRGKEQQIFSFEEDAGTDDAGSLSSTTLPAAQGTQNDSGASKHPPLVAFFFDTLNSPFANIMQSRDAANRFIDAKIPPSDQVAILSSDQLLTDFTFEPAKIHDALSRLTVSSHTPSAVRSCPDISEFQARELVQTRFPADAWQLAAAEIKQCHGDPPNPAAPPSSEEFGEIRDIAAQVLEGAAVKARTNLEQVEKLSKYLAALPGDRTIILVSPGFLTTDEQDQVDRIIDQALRAQVVINGLDPKGLSMMMRQLDASRGATFTRNQQALNASNRFDAGQRFQSGDVLSEFAQGTGGKFFYNDNDLAAGFEALAGHSDQYTLSFVPTDLKADGKFHELKVTLVAKQKGLTVSTRRGYFATVASPGKTADQQTVAVHHAVIPLNPAIPFTPSGNSRVGSDGANTLPAPPAQASGHSVDDPVRQAILGDTDLADLPIGVEVNPSEANDDGAGKVVSVLIHLDVNALPFKIDTDHSIDTVTFAAAVFDANGKAGVAKQRVAKLNVTPQQLTQLKANGLEVTLSFPVESGAHRIRAVVTESEGHKVGSLSKSIDVP